MKDDNIYVKGEELFKVFKEIDWDILYVNLQAYIVYILRYKYGIKKSNEDLRSKALEIISEVLDLIFITGTRNWCREDCPEFKSFLFGVVKSHISNSFSIKRKTIINIDEVINNEKNESQNHIQDSNSDSDLREMVFNELKSLNADDDELLVFECMADGITKPDKISHELGVEPKELNNILRRLNRKISKIKEKYLNNDII